MFGDYDWDGARSEDQRRRFSAWLGERNGSLAVIECGAGTAIPTIRNICEQLAAVGDATLVRINPRDPDAPPGALSIPSGSLAALRAIDAALQ
jgi:hypothetical protein